MKALFQIVLLVALFSSMASKASAQSKLLTKISCAVVSTNPPPGTLPMGFIAMGPAGLSCQDLRSVMRGFTAFKLFLAPIEAALLVPGTREAILSQIAAAGVTVSAPVVLVVAGVGVGVGSAAYFLVQASIEDCEKMEKDELRQKLIEELEQTYGIRALPTTSLEIQKTP